MGASADSVVHSDKNIVSGTPVFRGTRIPVQNMFDCLAYGEDLKDFNYGFPSVHPEQAIAALEMAKKAMQKKAIQASDGLYHCDPRIMGGLPVCVGTKDELSSLFDYLMQARSVKDFHYDFPSVEPWQSEAALRLAQQILEQEAYAAAA